MFYWLTVAVDSKGKTALAKKTSRKNNQSADESYTIHLLTTATGELISGLAAVAVTQFPDAHFKIISHPMQGDIEKLSATLDKLSGEKPLVLHALADEAAKLLVRNKCVINRIPHFDATGPLINFFADHVGLLPKNDATRLHQLNAAYLHRIEAIEYTMEHDDSLGMHSLQEADVVIVGISRVSKSPTALYLGSRGFKVANVSIALETGFPAVLSKISKKRIVAFTSQPKWLHEIRTERAKRMGSEGTSYEDLSSVIREVMEAEEEYRRRKFAIIDVTNLTIEQTASQILQTLKLGQMR